ncbi:hypothetical protein DFJ58DRAFT_840488 [Suillus subalutaceus]|uniref:uncharacterized protein n=1 Tax=Suillus subalutaceus TaxID=48586 RepID=UPI001B885062|nr:uncharacterized protein DFJ58DRAFT_840488 [Suillus subalutaceus]KAG1858014.1 hypothetical protein DFJ58DRAFT_840488 [Suillus subalutaceus]
MAVGHGELYHSQSPEGFLMGASGLKVVIPQSNAKASSSQLSAIPTQSYSWSPESSIVLQVLEQVPIDDFTLALSRAEILPRSDLTLLTWGTPVYHCQYALRLLNSPPPSLAPLIPPFAAPTSSSSICERYCHGRETVIESVRRTKRLVIVHEANVTGGVGGEIAAEVGKRAFLRLDAPVRRIAGWE